jgi:hypothetical protein
MVYEGDSRASSVKTIVHALGFASRVVKKLVAARVLLNKADSSF